MGLKFLLHTFNFMKQTGMTETKKKAVQWCKKQALEICRRGILRILNYSSVSAHLTAPLKCTGMYDEKKHQA